MKNIKKKMIWIIGSVFLFLILFIGVSNFIWISPQEVLFNRVWHYLTDNEEEWRNYQDYLQEMEIINASGYVSAQSESVAYIDPNDLYPVDTNRVVESIREREIQQIKDAHFENLKLAGNAPSDEDVRIALIHFTDGLLADVIINQKLNVKVGKCYENPNKPGCVSCMVMLYNRDTNIWQEAPMGENFMKNAYDFYLSGDGWGAEDLSMRIPFDYELFKPYGY